MTPTELAARYFESWRARDFAALGQLLADDVSFRGPLATLAGDQACIDGLRRMASIMTEVVVERVFADGDDILTWFELHTSVAPPVPVANWMHVEAGRIASIRVAFDARGFGPPGDGG